MLNSGKLNLMDTYKYNHKYFDEKYGPMDPNTLDPETLSKMLMDFFADANIFMPPSDDKSTLTNLPTSEESSLTKLPPTEESSLTKLPPTDDSYLSTPTRLPNNLPPTDDLTLTEPIVTPEPKILTIDPESEDQAKTGSETIDFSDPNFNVGDLIRYQNPEQEIDFDGFLPEDATLANATNQTNSFVDQGISFISVPTVIKKIYSCQTCPCTWKEEPRCLTEMELDMLENAGPLMELFDQYNDLMGIKPEENPFLEIAGLERLPTSGSGDSGASKMAVAGITTAVALASLLI